MQGKFIVIEGGDGAGKDANIDLLKAALSDASILWVKDPGGTEIGGQLREILQHGERVAKETELFLFLASRAQLVQEKILPALRSGIHVISNRFDLSTFAYQIHARGRESLYESLKAMSEIARGEANPDLVLLLDVAPGEGLARGEKRGEKKTRIEAEDIAFHEKVRAGYLRYVTNYPHGIIDANRPLPEVYADVERAVKDALAK